MSSIHEREIKILGPFPSLRQAFNNLSNNIYSTSYDQYTFKTLYLDTPDRILYNQGYTLRYRPNRSKFLPCMEVKQIDGSSGEVSDRVEIGVRRDTGFLSLYFYITANPDVKSQGIHIPHYSKLVPIYEIETDRVEMGGLIQIDGDVIILEASLDNVRYLKNGDVVGRDDELEIEDKSVNNESQRILEFSKRVVTEGISDIHYTTLSKSARAHKILVDKHLDI